MYLYHIHAYYLAIGDRDKANVYAWISAMTDECVTRVWYANVDGAW